MIFKDHSRHGTMAKIAPLNSKSQKSVATKYDNSFGFKAAKLWNIVPKDVKDKTSLDALKVAMGSYLNKFPDNPTVKGYTTANDNSLLSMPYQRSCLHED